MDQLRKTCFSFFLLGFLLMLSSCGPSMEKPHVNLVSPYPAPSGPLDGLSAAAPPDSSPASAAHTCPAPPAAPLTQLDFSPVYKRNDPSRSTVDPEKMETYREQTQNLRRFENKLSEMANRYTLSGKTDAGAAACILEWLHDWAQNDALLSPAEGQGAFVRQWTLASLASSFTQIKDYIPATDAQSKARQDIVSWLEKAAEVVKSRYQGVYEDAVDATDSRYNNHLYWGAWAVMISGIATDRGDQYRWGIEKARHAILLQIDNGNGSFPLELKRGAKALHYHLFALAPLIMIAEAAEVNGEHLYGLDDGILHKTVMLTLKSMNKKNGGAFAEMTGIAQAPISEISNEHFAWMEVYNRRFADPAIENFLASHRPLISRRLGGNMTALFNVPAAEPPTTVSPVQ